MEITNTLELAGDVIITSVLNLRPDIRQQFICEETDFVVTRPQGRARSLVIEREVAEFLETFRQPITFAQAITLFSKQKEMDADAFLRDIEDSVKLLLKARFLIVSGSHLAADYSLVAGQVVGDVTISHGINIMDDTEIYRCHDPDHKQMVMKIAKSEGDERTENLIKREFDILSVAPHPLTPYPHRIGKYQNRSFLLMDWCDGQDILTVANQLRNANRDVYPFNPLKDLVVHILRAYEWLHQAKIIHGDIHPNNCLTTREGNIHIIDFGLSLYIVGNDALACHERTGVPYFYDPSFATAYLNHTTPRMADEGTDLYSLAALSFFLLTGHHYLPFRLTHEHFYEQIKSEPQRSFHAVGVPSWWEIEAVLSKALSKDEKERFSSVREFADALAILHFTPGESKKIVQKANPTASLAAIARYQTKGLDFDWPLPAPTAPVHFGGAGIAYALLKCAEKGKDQAVLSDADIWITRAKESKMLQAYQDESMGLTSEVAAPGSLHYGKLGVCVCEALIAYARWDYTVLNQTLADVCHLALTSSNDFDLTYGKPGSLLGCALLLATIPDDPLLPMKHSILETGEQLVSAITTALQSLGQIATNNILVDLGMAHGWAGALYAIMKWAETTQTLPHPTVEDYLNELIQCSILTAEGRSWPIRTNTPHRKTERFMGSWCKGSTGFVHLFGLAAQLFNKPDYLEIAGEAADFTFTAPQNGASLCCGDAGMAYAQLSMFQRTREDKYVGRAQVLADRAANSELKLAGSLYKGRLGVHLLLLDMENPLAARMPFFD
ncbi:lanthionine synthetase LanC family protein [Mucilaginibacter agri]|uniref:Protein kinase n=1 Tax=Mucilaginibacter agri TaxID=2695265 RepID=A0A966DT05_9SPHI|nr:lanthionine synthetase LanC family protein [Mucilaginibacter agri]NCD68259.1 protein kinase [Mucilaginibacter agri]